MTDLAAKSLADGSAPPERPALAALFGRLLFTTRFMTIWIAAGVLLVVCQIFAPETLSSTSMSATLLPFGSVVAVVALGQMLVIMMGGIDLSMAATISLLANLLVGTAQGSGDRLPYALAVVLFWAIVIGLVNGFLIAVIELNPLIVTLATSYVIAGITTEYRVGNANNTSVPDSLAETLYIDKVFGINTSFWLVLVLVLLVGLLLRSTGPGRKFQAVGANRRAAWMAGIKVRSYVVASYVLASIAGGVAAVMLSAALVSPGATPGDRYLLGPVAAVVLAGASLTGGLASPMSTWLAAFFVTVLNQMLKVLGLPVNSQPIVFGIAIVLGMLISGDRIAELIGRLLVIRPGLRSMIDETSTSPPASATPTTPAGTTTSGGP